MESSKIRRRGKLSSSIVAAASWSVLSALLLSLVVLGVSLPLLSLSFLSLGVAGSDLRLPLVVMLVFQGEELGGTASGRGGEMGELESAGGRGEEVGGGRAGARWGGGGGGGGGVAVFCSSPVQPVQP